MSVLEVFGSSCAESEAGAHSAGARKWTPEFFPLQEMRQKTGYSELPNDKDILFAVWGIVLN